MHAIAPQTCRTSWWGHPHCPQPHSCFPQEHLVPLIFSLCLPAAWINWPPPSPLSLIRWKSKEAERGGWLWEGAIGAPQRSGRWGGAISPELCSSPQQSVWGEKELNENRDNACTSPGWIFLVAHDSFAHVNAPPRDSRWSRWSCGGESVGKSRKKNPALC